MVEGKSKLYVPEEGAVMFTVAENSNRTNTLKCPLNLLSWMSLKTNKSFVSWGQTPDRSEPVGEEDTAMATGNMWVGLLGGGREREGSLKGTADPRRACF